VLPGKEGVKRVKLKTRLMGQSFSFKSVKEVLAKANEIKSGDILAGIAAENAAERIAAKYVLSQLTLEDLRNNPVVPLEADEVSRIIDNDVTSQSTGQSRIGRWPNFVSIF
jgi:ethanolamine ammonia-lyase large subunit